MTLSSFLADNPDNEFGGAKYEMAGSFWTLVGNTELFMTPGAYPGIPDSFDET